METADYILNKVASFAEAWIEICWIALVFIAILVASFAEAWIEISLAYAVVQKLPVASFAEAWIEIFVRQPCSRDSDCRLLRGGVD